jgi:hypothetical protein
MWRVYKRRVIRGSVLTAESLLCGESCLDTIAESGQPFNQCGESRKSWEVWEV